MHYALLNIFLDVYVAKSTQLMRSLIISILFAEGFTLLVVMVFIIIILRLTIINLRLAWVLACLVGSARISS